MRLAHFAADYGKSAGYGLAKLQQPSDYIMAPNLPKIKRAELECIVISKLKGEEDITDADIAQTIISCSDQSVRNARSNILKYGRIDAPRDNVGRPRKITDNMWLAIKAKNDQCPGMNHQAIADFLEEAFGVTVDRRTVAREMKRRDWTGRVPQEVARERDEDLRADFLVRRANYPLDTIICVDESGCDRSLGMSKKVYGPRGIRPRRVKRFHRGKRVQILPAYTIEGVIYCEVYEENTDLDVFEGFMERLLPHCNPFPQPRSVIYMDNASFHFSKRLEKLIANAGVILEYSVPYSPDLMPVESWFGSFKNIIRAEAQKYQDLIRGDFKSFIKMQIGKLMQDEKGAKKMARGHFRLAGFRVEVED